MFGGIHQRKTAPEYQNDAPVQGRTSDARTGACADRQVTDSTLTRRRTQQSASLTAAPVDRPSTRNHNNDGPRPKLWDIANTTSKLRELAGSCTAGQSKEDIRWPPGGASRGLRTPSPEGLGGPQ